MTQYQIIVEKTSTGYSCYAPAVPGCVATGKTKEVAEANMKKALEMHFEEMGKESPELSEDSYATHLSVA